VILTGNEIRRQVEKGTITLEPFDVSQLNPNSYNYRLGETIRLSDTVMQNPRASGKWRSERIPQSGLLLVPGRFYLGHTFETIGSNVYVPSLIGRSSLGRLGLYLQISADLGQLGSIHKWTLELTVVQPLRVYPGMRVGQVSFWCSFGDHDPYVGRYVGTDLPTSSRLWLDSEEEGEED
jgi:dCTP deaminase